MAPRRQVWIEVPDDALAGGRRASYELPVGRMTSGGPDSPTRLSLTGGTSRSSPDLGGSRPSTAGSTPSRSSRFTSEEKKCFRRLPTPSSTCEDKLGTYFATVGKARQAASERGLCNLPVNKGQFHTSSSLQHMIPPKPRSRLNRRTAVCESGVGGPLEIEAMAAYVLDEIYPVPPGASRRLSHTVCHRLVSKEGGMGQPNATQSRPKSPTGLDASRRSMTGSRLHPGVWNSQHLEKEETDQLLMGRFRSALLQRFHTLQEAVEAFTRDVDIDRNLTKAEWRNLLAKHMLLGFSGRKEINSLFKLFDLSGAGNSSVRHLHTALELSAPVRTVETLRRNWIARGHSSMNSAIRTLVGEDDYGVRSRRLSLLEFGDILSQAGIVEDEEHLALFNAICSDEDGTVSIEELHCAVAAVSPSLLLEELRDRLTKRYKGDWHRAFYDWNEDHGGNLTRISFVQKCVDVLELSRLEAEKVFREIDVDHSGDIDVQELISALAVVEPSLSIEDLRFKLRQRFQAIRGALNKAFADDVLDGEHSPDAIPKSRFQAVLEPLGLLASECDRLFHMLDADGDGELTPREFLAGTRRLMPSHSLEDMRTCCWQQHGHVRNAFVSVKSRGADPLNFKAFNKKLTNLGLLSEALVANAQSIFDLLDVNHEGQASINRLVAALCASGAGSHAKLPPEELSQKAREDVAADLTPFARNLQLFKTQVRYGLEWDIHGPWHKDHGQHHIPADFANEKVASLSSAAAGAALAGFVAMGADAVSMKGLSSSSPTTAACARTNVVSVPEAHAPATKDPVRAQAALPRDSETDADAPECPTAAGRTPTAPRLRTTTQEQLPDFVRAVPQLVGDCKSRSELQVHDIQDSYGVVWQSLQDTPKHLRPGAKLQKNLQKYFESAAMQLSEKVPYTQQLQSRRLTGKESACPRPRHKPTNGRPARGGPVTRHARAGAGSAALQARGRSETARLQRRGPMDG